MAYDLMEIFRPQVVDRVVLAELRRRREAFAVDGEGKLTVASRKELVFQVESRLATVHPFRGRELKLSEIIQVQAQDLRRYLERKGRFRPYTGRW